jgi:hypothetical protein
MANITKSSTIGFDSISAINGGLRISELTAGSAIAAGDAVYIKSDGLVYSTDGTTETTQSSFVGLVARSYVANQPVTIFGQGNVFEYSSGSMTPGNLLWVSGSATAGGLSDAKVLATDVPVARAINLTNVVILR